MSSDFHWLAASLCILSGCVSSPLERADQAISGYDFAGALKILGETGAGGADAGAIGLRMIALFGEQRDSAAFEELAHYRRSDNDGAHGVAKLLWRAANAISREKDRTTTVIAILDTLAAADPSMKEQALQLAWQRGIEYLQMSGDAGYRCLNWVVRNDPAALARLRAYDIILARRFEEIGSMEKSLPRYTQFARRYLAVTGHIPKGLADLQLAFPQAGLVTPTGWDIEIGGYEGLIVAEAHAALGNPYGIPRGTVLVGK